MSDTVRCIRCAREAPAIAGDTYPGALGAEIAAKVCAACWAEWRQAEVMVINELRLDFMDPQAQDTLVAHMKEFLGLTAPAPPSGEPG